MSRPVGVVLAILLVHPGALAAQYAAKTLYPVSARPADTVALASADTVSRGTGLLIELTLATLGAAALGGVASVASDNDEMIIGAIGTGAFGGALMGSHAAGRRPSFLGALLGAGIPTVAAIVVSANASDDPAESGHLVPIVTLTVLSVVGAVWGSHAAWR
jgi:hypothetical protein